MKLKKKQYYSNNVRNQTAGLEGVLMPLCPQPQCPRRLHLAPDYFRINHFRFFLNAFPGNLSPSSACLITAPPLLPRSSCHVSKRRVRIYHARENVRSQKRRIINNNNNIIIIITIIIMIINRVTVSLTLARCASLCISTTCCPQHQFLHNPLQEKIIIQKKFMIH